MSTPPHPTSAPGVVTLRYWAAARAAAGVDSDAIEVTGPTPLAELLARARALHTESSRFSDVVGICSVMIGDRPVATQDPGSVLVDPGATVQLLPPFAGG